MAKLKKKLNQKFFKKWKIKEIIKNLNQIILFQKGQKLQLHIFKYGTNKSTYLSTINNNIYNKNTSKTKFTRPNTSNTKKYNITSCLYLYI